MFGGDRTGLQTVMKNGRYSPVSESVIMNRDENVTQQLIALTNPLFEEDLYERPNRNVSNRKKKPLHSSQVHAAR